MSAAGKFMKVGIACVALPLLAAAAGAALQASIPGCRCDTGGGCRGCAGLDDLIAFLLFGGFAGALAALIFILPASLLLALGAAMSGNERRRLRHAFARRSRSGRRTRARGFPGGT
jgi:hypothetical protein